MRLKRSMDVFAQRSVPTKTDRSQWWIHQVVTGILKRTGRIERGAEDAGGCYSLTVDDWVKDAAGRNHRVSVPWTTAAHVEPGTMKGGWTPN